MRKVKLLHGTLDWRCLYEPDREPEEFFDNIRIVSEDDIEEYKKKGWILVGDSREENGTGFQTVNGKHSFFFKYGKPNALLMEIAEDAGIEFGSVECISWGHEGCLTILRDRNFIFTAWAGLKIKNLDTKEFED